jgi:hypothetical protein
VALDPEQIVDPATEIVGVGFTVILITEVPEH